MAYAMTATNPVPSSPYLTVEEFKQAPTGVDTNLVRNDAGASRAELQNTIARASSWADQICNQVLAATPDTEAGRVWLTRDGTVRIHPRQTPVLELTAFSYGDTPGNLLPLTTLTSVWVEATQIVVPLSSFNGTFSGPLQFGPQASNGPLYAQWSYVAGWPNTTLAATATAGATSITVTNPVGILPGLTWLTIYDGAQTETVQVAATYTPGSTTIPLAAALTENHGTAGVSVSALPPAVKQAVILLTAALIKTRGAAALVMGSPRGTPEKRPQGESGSDEDIDTAEWLLSAFKRVR